MISTRQCSLFTIACPMPDCFPEKGGRKKGNQNNNEQKTVVNKDGEKMKINEKNKRGRIGCSLVH